MSYILFALINGYCMLTENHNAFLDKVFKVREKTKSLCQPLEALAAPQTPNLPILETHKSPKLTNKKKRSRKFSKPAQKRCKRSPAVVRAGGRSGPAVVNSGIKSAWSATALLTISSVYNAAITPPVNLIQDQQHTSNLETLPGGM